MIYPRNARRRRINHLIVRPWARQWWQVRDGKLLLFAVKVRRGVDILNRPLAEIVAPDAPFHITAVKRNGETLIPHGNDCLEEDDLVFVMTTPKDVAYCARTPRQITRPRDALCLLYGAADTVIHSINTLPHHIKAKVFERNPAKFDAITGAITNRSSCCSTATDEIFALCRTKTSATPEVFVAASENSETTE